MAHREILTLVLTGGKGGRLSALAGFRSKPFFACLGSRLSV